jgi:tetratricopeptide (TPR) repeat protein
VKSDAAARKPAFRGSLAWVGASRDTLRRHAAVIGCALCLVLAAAVLQPLTRSIASRSRLQEPALRAAATTVGPGIAVALLGGFRALVADALWIRLYITWEKRDLAATDAAIRLVSLVDPRLVYFWLNGARITAYDLAAWRIDAEGGCDVVSLERQNAIIREQARRALDRLDRAFAFHADSVDLWIERANIELNRIQDVAAAAESYRRAAELPRAPYYAARLHAEMLRRLGRNTEALEWLVRLHPTLPDEEAAAPAVVLGRIRELERLTGVRPENSYRPLPR